MAAKPESQRFRHTRLCDNRPNFRLLRLDKTCTSQLRCELIEAQLNDRDLLPYTAISYRWQNGEKTQAIWIGGAKFLVTPGLLSLLLSLQEASLYHQHPWYEYGYFWIDAICIDQNDEAEKSHQISHMKKIYTNATHVVVWLGDATSDSKLVMKGLATLQNLKEQQEREPYGPVKVDETRLALLWGHYVLKDNECDRLAESLSAMLSHSWFKRVWVLQEVANARSAFILCGNESISTRYFVLASRLLGVEPSPHCQAVLDLMPGSRKKRFDTDGDGSKSDLYNLLLRFRGAEASLDKDRIFALFGLCSEDTTHLALKYYSMPQLEIFRAIISHVWGCSIELVPRRLVMPSASYGQCLTIDEFLSDLEGISTALLMHWVSTGSGMKYSDLRDILLSRCVYTPAQALEAVAQHPTHAAELVSLVACRIPQQSFRVSDAILLSIARNGRQVGR